MLKLQCDRCGSLFSGLDQRREHLRQDEPCTKREIDATAIDEGISEETCRRLKKRNGLSKLSEHDKWIRIFRILFPNCVVDVETEPCERCFVSVPIIHTDFTHQTTLQNVVRMDHLIFCAIDSFLRLGLN